MLRNTAPASGRASSASICASKRSGVCRSIMSRIASISGASARRAGCTIGSDPDAAHRAHALLRARAPAARSRAARSSSPAAPAGSGRQPVSSSARRSHALRRAANDLQRDSPAHRMPRQREGRRRRRKHALGHRAEASGPVPSRGPGTSTNAPRRGTTGSHAARSQTSPGSSSSGTPRGEARTAGDCGGMVECDVVRSAARAEHSPPAACASPNRGNTRRALPSKILPRSSALSHSIGSR